jgi:hypothetical protein
MRRRSFLIAAPFAALAAASHHHARAAEAAVPQLGEFVGSGLTDAERMRMAGRLQREGFALAGDIRRKGQLIVAVALQQGVPWRLVIDGQSGEIIGRRPLAEQVALPR